MHIEQKPNSGMPSSTNSKPNICNSLYCDDNLAHSGFMSFIFETKTTA